MREGLLRQTRRCLVVVLAAFFVGCAGKPESIATNNATEAAPSQAEEASAPNTSPDASPGESPAASAAASVTLDASVFYAGFIIHVTQALTQGDGSIELTAEFTNLGLATATIDTASGNGSSYIEWQGSISPVFPSGQTSVPAGNTLRAELTGGVPDGFTLSDATLVFGAVDEHQSRVPLSGGQPVETQLPRAFSVSGSTRVGRLVTITVAHGEVVPATCDGSAGSFVFEPAAKNKESILLTVDAKSRKNPYGTNAATKLATPNGPSIETDSQSIYVPPNGAARGVVVCYTVPTPAAGHFTSHWEAIDDPAKPNVTGNIPLDVPAP
jgi:hypothetical protein